MTNRAWQRVREAELVARATLEAHDPAAWHLLAVATARRRLLSPVRRLCRGRPSTLDVVAYIDLALLAGDGDFWQRTSACAASEMISGTVPDGDPQQWATENRWTLAAQPGFADAYAYALQTGVDHPASTKA